MKSALVLTALFGATACIVQAGTEEEVCREMQAALAEQVKLLSGVKDAPSAAAVLPGLKRNMAALSALQGKVSDAELWLHIDNHPDLKQQLIEQLQMLSVELSRLRKAKYFADRALWAALAPYFTPAGGAR